MSESQVTPEEVASLAGDQADHQNSGVRPRDFREPLRLSAEQLDDLRLDFSARTNAASSALRPWLRAECSVEVENVAETRFPGLLQSSARGDVTAFSFQVESGETGWFLWECDAAGAAVDRALGSAAENADSDGEEDADPSAEDSTGAESAEGEEDPNEKPIKRVFSSVERALLGEILAVLTAELLEPFQVVTSNFEMLQTREELLFSSEANRGGDLQRLYAGFHLEGPGVPSTFRILVPGLGTSKSDAASTRALEIPEHLDDVPLQVSAVLGTIELPLQSLLGLEVGDVIPLDTRAGASLRLLLGDEEQKLFAKARFGKSEGRIAVQIEQTHLPQPGADASVSPPAR